MYRSSTVLTARTSVGKEGGGGGGVGSYKSGTALELPPPLYPSLLNLMGHLSWQGGNVVQVWVCVCLCVLQRDALACSMRFPGIYWANKISFFSIFWLLSGGTNETPGKKKIFFLVFKCNLLHLEKSGKVFFPLRKNLGGGVLG